MKGKYIGEFEEIVLLVICILLEEAYGVAIKDEIENRLGRKVSMGAMHATLVRMEKKGYIESAFGEATQKRGGKRKRIFKVTTIGQEALQKTKHTREALWDAIPKTVFE